MKHRPALCAAALCLILALAPTALAAELDTGPVLALYPLETAFTAGEGLGDTAATIDPVTGAGGKESLAALDGPYYVFSYEETAPQPAALETAPEEAEIASFNWSCVLVPLGIVFAVSGIVGGCLLYKHKHENDENGAE